MFVWAIDSVAVVVARHLSTVGRSTIRAGGMPMQAFRLWLNDQQDRDDAVGELSRLVRRDACQAKFDYDSVRAHLAREHHATDSLLAQLDVARDEWALRSGMLPRDEASKDLNND